MGLRIREPNWIWYFTLGFARYNEKGQKQVCFPRERRSLTNNKRTDKNQTLHQEEVGGLGHHVRGDGMSPRRYILGA